ncbi:MAG: HD domain-containing protein [Methanomassiliicoccaceae archaeon]|jgi:HD superfamily phosphohydrolase|nr:HD domain-containing protein [Methanomassiliicoccaceae archaeon]
MTEKVIHDPLHGSIVVDGVFLKLLSRHEVQRLHNVKQLGMANTVFPGANHTRLEHSLGVYHLAGRMAKALRLSEDDTRHVCAAALLHDVCHLPYSHNISEMYEHRTGTDHMELAKPLIKGTIPTYSERDEDILGGTETMAEVLEENGISSDTVCDLIAKPRSAADGLGAFMSDGKKQSFFSSKDHLHQMIHGPVDADQMDYLLRDAHYTGVAHGSIDIERLLTQMKVFNNTIVIERGGVVAAEGLMVSRALMYTSVYFNKTVRIAEMMLSKAVELSDIDIDAIHLMDDPDLRNELITNGGRPSEMMRALIHRRLYKKAFSAYSIDLDEDQIGRIARYSRYENKKRLEDEIAEDAGIDYSDVIVDIPSRSSLLSNAKIGKTDVSIYYDGRVRPITRISPVSKALQNRDMFDWAVMISSPFEHVEKVRRAASSILNL